LGLFLLFVFLWVIVLKEEEIIFRIYIMKFKKGELKVKRYCSECQKWCEVTIDVDECPECGEILLMDSKEEQLEDE